MCMYATGNKFTCMWNNQSKGEILVFNARNKKRMNQVGTLIVIVRQIWVQYFWCKKLAWLASFPSNAALALHPMLYDHESNDCFLSNDSVTVFREISRMTTDRISECEIMKLMTNISTIILFSDMNFKLFLTPRFYP